MSDANELPSDADETPLVESTLTVPIRGEGMIPMVGLGASAGGIVALQQFFAGMPVDSGMAFVVIMHLSSEHESTLAELFQRSTAMPVVTAKDKVQVKANCVYIIPPGHHLTVVDGHLRLAPAEETRGKRVAVDAFFRTLADTHGAQSVAVVFSGAGGDGALGLKRIKECGGLTIAQDPAEAEHSDMPRAAIATGMVDWVLPVREIPARLSAYAGRQRHLRLPAEEGPHPAQQAASPSEVDEAALREVLAFLRIRTSRDFSYYKRATILRRIARRMQVNGLDDLPGYLVFIRTHAGEAVALLQDLLISVTNFFRDPDSFTALERIVPELFKDKGPGESVRVWVAGCATGEEAYSIAMLLCEHARTLEAPPQLQIFATDLDEDVIREARDGIYPETITTDVSEERLRRFFIHEQDGYRVRREVREIVLFAQHDLLKDSPFSRLDLVSCRNLLIYLNREAQQRAFDIFHYALRPGGGLFLGTSETVEDGNSLFAVIDKKQRLYLQRPGPRQIIAVPVGPSTLARALEMQGGSRERPTVPGRVPVEGVRSVSEEPLRFDTGLPPGELHYRLIERFSPPSILVNAAHEIVHLSESAGRFLHFSGGEPTRNLLHAVHPMLRIELRAALYAAKQTQTVATAFHVPVETGEERSLVDLRVTPAGDLAPDFLLVVFEVHPTDGSPAVALPRSAEADQVAQHLERELEATKAHLRETIEESEASTEELKASNEELQAMNEELRSATEELETSREELQSINEELNTVNDALKSNVEGLARSNSDLQNLMVATDIAIVFLDRELRIQRFTPAAMALFNFISTDLGRPLSDLSRQIDYPEIVADAERALAHLQPAEREVRAGDRCYLARALPYRTDNDHIAGVVFTFLDITEQKRADDILRLHRDRLDFVLKVTGVGLWLNELPLSQLDWNDRVRALFFVPPGVEPTIELFYDRLHPDDREPTRNAVEVALRDGTLYDIDHRVVDPATGAMRWIKSSGQPIYDDKGEAVRFDGVSIDLTDRKVAEEALRGSEERYRTLFASAPMAVFACDQNAVIQHYNARAAELWGRQPVCGVEQHCGSVKLWLPDGTLLPHTQSPMVEMLRTGIPVHNVEVFIERPDGSRLPVLVNFAALKNAQGKITGAITSFMDITERKRAEEHIAADLAAMTRLHQVGIRCVQPGGDYDKCISGFVEAAIALTGASKGNIQLLNDATGTLTIAAHSGFEEPFLKFFGNVRAGEAAACGAAMRSAGRVLVEDVTQSEIFAGQPSLDVLLEAGVRAVQSTPLVSGAGHVLGMISTHFCRPRRFSERELRLMDLLARQAADYLERKRGEEALRESEERFRAIADNLPQLAWLADGEGRVGWFNKRWLDYTGTTLEDNTGAGWKAVHHPDYIEAVAEKFERHLREGKDWEDTFPLRGKDGEYRWFLSRMKVIRDEAGHVVRFFGTNTDITERKRAEEAMARLAALVESSDDGLFGQDLNGIITSWNRGAEQIFGYRADEIVGMPVLRLIPAEAQAEERELQRKIVAGERVGNFETTRQAKDGRQFPVSITISPLKDGDGKVIGASKVVRDISAHKAAEATTLTAHRRLQNVLGSITDGLAVLDKDWRYTYLSEQAARIIGINAADVLGGCLWDLFPAAEGTKFYEGYHRAVATGQKVEFEEYYPEPINKWLECHCYPSDEGLSVYFHDVTARKQAEEELRASNQRTLLATEATGVGIWEWNVLTGEIRWDVQMFRLYGITPTADGFVQYSTWSQTVLPEDLQEQEAILQSTIRRAGHSSRAFRIRRKSDGECRHIESVETAWTNAKGQTEWIIGTNLDVTESRKAEDARRQNEALFSTLIEQAPLGVYVVDSEFRLQQVNSLAEPVFSNVRPLIGRDFTEVMRIIWGPEVGGEVARIFRHTLETGERYISPPFVHPRADLRVEQAYDWETQRVTLPDGRHGVVCYFVDVTERRRAEAALLAAKEAADAANRSKDRFLAVLSHELRTPLNPVLMTVAALEQDPGLRPDVLEDLAMIRRNVELETRLIDDLLDLSRITSGKVALKSQAVELNEAVRHVCGICREELLEKDIRLEMDLGDGVGFISADPARLQQILWNVLKNAVKFTPAQGIVRVRTVRLGPDRCEVRVEDNGIGIPETGLARIFDAFEQGEAHITRQFGGLGLGLAITRALVELQGGKIRAESAGPGQGATFSIEMPGQPAKPVSPPPADKAKAPASDQPLRILLVEDHADTVRTLSRLLRKEGFEVVTASDVAGAVAAAERDPPDVLVSDLGLPDGNGHDLMRALLAIHPMRGIAMSGYGMKEDLRRSREAGFAEHLVKPVSMADLIAAIRRVGPKKTDLPANEADSEGRREMRTDS